MTIKTILLGGAAALTLSLPLIGCGGMTMAGRAELAQDIAAPARLVRKDIPAGEFILARWERIAQPGGPVRVYIEGDGTSWLSKSTPSNNPTPKDPLALRLAALDPAANVVYLARPCHYTPIGAAGNQCHDVYWRGKRFAPEVIQSFMTAMDQIAREHAATNFDLVGFSGGANVAGLLAARRTDVSSIRTVAGNVDNDYFMAFHKVSAMPLSLNMASEADRIAHIPQIHFIGAADETVPRDIFDHYAAKTGGSPCVTSRIVEGADHLNGWTARWTALLQEPLPGC